MRSLLVNDPRNAGTQWADFELDSFAAAHESGISARLPYATGSSDVSFRE
jgi:hypothetical protein